MRAFAISPNVLLLDEPFGMLDSLTRMELQEVRASSRSRDKKTALMVTHDVDEALFLSDRVGIAQRFGDGGIRTTYDLILTGIPAAAKQEVDFELARYGLTFEPRPGVAQYRRANRQAVLQHCSPRRRGAYRLIEELRRRRLQLHGICMAMSGCPSSYTADIGMKNVKIRRGFEGARRLRPLRRRRLLGQCADGHRVPEEGALRPRVLPAEEPRPDVQPSSRATRGSL